MLNICGCPVLKLFNFTDVLKGEVAIQVNNT